MSSFDVGSHLDGCQDPTTYVPGKLTRVYFAHPVTTYDTALELECESFVRRYVGEVEIVNPNSVEYQREYSRTKDFKFWTDLARTCDICVFLPFEDKLVGSGVHAEIQTFYERFGKEARVYEFDTTEQLLIFRQSPYFDNPRRVLSIQATRDRIASHRGTT